MIKVLIYSAALLIWAFIPAFSQDTVYPSGYNLQCYYTVSGTELSITDTLIISRKMVNDEDFPLENLYFCENLPAAFTVAGHSITLNDIAIDYMFSGPVADEVVAGYDTYYWVIDSPFAGEEANNLLNPGDSVELTIRIVSGNVGSFTLPHHSAVFFGNSTGFFSTSGESTVEFLLSVAVDDDDNGPLIPADNLIVRAGPNPFNSSVKIWYSGAVQNSPIDIEIYNILGQVIYSKRLNSINSNGNFTWVPDYRVGSGVYFYRLISADESRTGKLLLLK